MTKKEIDSILDYNFIIPNKSFDGINIFSGEKVQIYTDIVTNDCTEVAAIYAITCESEEPNTLHQKECSTFLVTSYPKIYLRNSLDDALKIIKALKIVNKFTKIDSKINLKDIVF